MMTHSIPARPTTSGWPTVPGQGQQLPLPLGWEPLPLVRPDLSTLAQMDEALLPLLVRQCEVTRRYLRLLAPLAWHELPERDPNRAWPGPQPHPRAAYVAAFLIKLEEDKEYMSDLRDYLVEHPALVWALGFHLQPDPDSLWGFDVQASLPTSRHFGRVLRELPNEALQFLLDQTVHLLQLSLPPELEFGQTISLDTQAILAWVAENNPKAYISLSDRLDKTRQPAGDPDCKLGCKRKANVAPASSQVETTAAESGPTPTKQAVPVTNFSSSDEYYWGYASGVVATKVPDWGEFVLAEWTQPFNRSDVTYFFPLMAETERRLGFRPPYGALDCAYDAFYVYDHFAEVGGFAAVPFAERGGYKDRQFDEQGQPLCQAGRSMPLKTTFTCRTTEVEHQRGRYACPLLYPEPNGETCPVAHRNWPKGGCLVTMPTAEGARIRYQLDRESEAFKAVYRQRTATERVNAQATALRLTRPKLRRGSAIRNYNTLLYALINLRALHRVRRQVRQREAANPPLA